MIFWWNFDNVCGQVLGFGQLKETLAQLKEALEEFRRRTSGTKNLERPLELIWPS